MFLIEIEDIMTTDNHKCKDVQQTIYSELGYKSMPFPYTTPATLGSLCSSCGLFLHLTLKLLEYLELGATYGGNIISQALFNPDATFVGIELSQEQVEKGNEVIANAGLDQCIPYSIRHLASIGSEY